MIKVAIIEDDQRYQDALKRELERDNNIEVVAACRTPTEFMALVDTHRPDVTIHDLRLQGTVEVGLKVLEEVKRKYPDTKCIVVTAHPDLDNFRLAKSVGAEAFTKKDANPELEPTLPELVHRTMAGGRYYHADVIDELFEASKNLMPMELEGDDESHISDRELEVMKLVAAGLTNEEIAEELSVSISTVKSHLGSINKKLGTTSREKAVIVALSKGILEL